MEELATPEGAASRGRVADGGDGPRRLGDLQAQDAAPVPTGIGELDRVTGGGLVPGSVTLLGGEPGIGKSTILLQAVGSMAARGARALLVSAEESGPQVRRRAERLGVEEPDVWLVAETALPAIRAAVEAVRPDVVVVDSIQTVWDPELASAPGSVGQVRECAHALAGMARAHSAAMVLVGHVTKDGALAGPRVLEHLVDTVLTFEGDRHHALRMLHATKHRFGPTGELGLFEMGEAGMRGVPDAAGLFLGDRPAETPGSVIFPALEGARPLLVEVQALVAPTRAPAPRRSANGMDHGRLGLLLAVLDRRAGVRTGEMDVYASAVGGVRIAEPAADLPLALAVASAVLSRAVSPGVVVIGEIGLGGEIRQVSQTPRRLAEAARLGFTSALVPANAPTDLPLPAARVRTVAEALEAVFEAPFIAADCRVSPPDGRRQTGDPEVDRRTRSADDGRPVEPPEGVHPALFRPSVVR